MIAATKTHLAYGRNALYPTSQWWWFIVGIIGPIVISKANQGANAGNVLDAAMIDRDFYERVRKINGWQYQIDEVEAQRYRAA
ncbi:hypothetical protein ABIB99_004952 [Bradyrhizobium sp. LA6.1]|uniref:hypothetical protein n=1 Tax=Bradyrhizobium sp. LA6.1 TaxID=3156378 RepID=UPI003397E434